MALKWGKPEGIAKEKRKFAWKPSVAADVGCIAHSFEYLLDTMLFHKSIHLGPGRLPLKSLGSNRHLRDKLHVTSREDKIASQPHGQVH